MGLILDSTAVVAVERAGSNSRQLLEALARLHGDEEVAISVITVLELAHGVERANSIERRSRRERFLEELILGVPVQPVTIPIALRAGQIDGRSLGQGIRIPLSDLLIGATALELDYAVGTANLRHFELIPELRVIEI